jgi:small subunit ribosomal protein S8
MTDPIADMLTRIRNASRVRQTEVFVPFSKIKLEIIKILKKEGLIEGFEELKIGPGGSQFGGLQINLKYDGQTPAISSLKKISKPGHRIYATKTELPRVLNNLGLAIISTSRGVMSNKEAKKLGLGGEVICEIY